jgi:hypothetical protein
VYSLCLNPPPPSASLGLGASAEVRTRALPTDTHTYTPSLSISRSLVLYTERYTAGRPNAIHGQSAAVGCSGSLNSTARAPRYTCATTSRRGNKCCPTPLPVRVSEPYTHIHTSLHMGALAQASAQRARACVLLRDRPPCRSATA